MILSAVRNVPKKGLPKITREPIRERGRLRNGENPEMISCSETPSAVHAVLQARFLITPTEMSTAYLHTSTYPVLYRTADPAITVFITVDSNARDAVRLERNKKVEFAIGALAQTIRNELYLIESTHNESGTKSNLIKINLPMRGKKNEG